MLRLLQAGLVAAGRQLAAVMIVTLFLSRLTSYGLIGRDALTTCNGIEAFGMSTPRLTWAYLLVATGLALSRSQSIDLTAERLRHASHLMRLARPEHTLMALVVQLGLSTILFAVFTLRTPPEPLTDVASYFGCASAASVIWAAAMSIGVACFGASTHATLRALGTCRLSR